MLKRQARLKLTTPLRYASRKRLAHSIAQLGLNKEVGIPGLLSPKGLDVAWFQYQSYLIRRINELVEKMPEFESSATLFNLMADALASPEPGAREIAVYASQAYNNEFFFRSLRAGSVNEKAKIGYDPEAEKVVDISTTVLNDITGDNTRGVQALDELVKSSFDSVLSLRELIINRANSICGNGCVWLIWTDSRLGLVNTYNWASLYSHEEVNKPEDVAHGGLSPMERSPARIIVGAQSAKVESFVPILGINAWEHVYLTDYGICGKKAYLRNVFDCIDWSIVKARLPRMQIGCR